MATVPSDSVDAGNAVPERKEAAAGGGDGASSSDEEKQPGVNQIESYAGLPNDAPTSMKALKYRKGLLLSTRGRALNKRYPLGPFYPGMYAPPVRRHALTESQEKTPAWFKAYYQDKVGLADFESEVNSS